MTNRYTQVTPSQFQPLSLQEIMLVPTLKRQHHDAAIAAMEQLRDLQADPHDLHRDEALRLKSDFENKLNTDIELLNSQGYNPSIVSNLSRLNKEYRDLTGPMGRIGQINAANKAYQQRFKDYMENAQKNGQSREVALWNWENVHKPTWTGYDDDGNITQIGEYGAPVRQDFMKYVSDLASKVGFDEEGTAWASSKLSYDANQNRFVVNSSGSNVTKDNFNRLQNLANLLTSELEDPRSKYRLDMDFNREDPNEMLYRASQLLDSRREYSSIDKRNESKGSVSWAEGYGKPNPYRRVNVGTETQPSNDSSKSYQQTLIDINSGIGDPLELARKEEAIRNANELLTNDERKILAENNQKLKEIAQKYNLPEEYMTLKLQKVRDSGDVASGGGDLSHYELVDQNGNFIKTLYLDEGKDSEEIKRYKSAFKEAEKYSEMTNNIRERTWNSSIQRDGYVLLGDTPNARNNTLVFTQQFVDLIKHQPVATSLFNTGGVKLKEGDGKTKLITNTNELEKIADEAIAILTGNDDSKSVKLINVPNNGPLDPPSVKILIRETDPKDKNKVTSRELEISGDYLYDESGNPNLLGAQLENYSTMDPEGGYSIMNNYANVKLNQEIRKNNWTYLTLADDLQKIENTKQGQPQPKTEIPINIIYRMLESPSYQRDFMQMSQGSGKIDSQQMRAFAKQSKTGRLPYFE